MLQWFCTQEAGTAGGASGGVLLGDPPGRSFGDAVKVLIATGKQRHDQAFSAGFADVRPRQIRAAGSRWRTRCAPSRAAPTTRTVKPRVSWRQIVSRTRSTRGPGPRETGVLRRHAGLRRVARRGSCCEPAAKVGDREAGRHRPAHRERPPRPIVARGLQGRRPAITTLRRARGVGHDDLQY